MSSNQNEMTTESGSTHRVLKTYIMCGGSGTRLWPLSRADNPKQMLPLLDENSMLANTISRAASMPLDAVTDVSLIGAASHRNDLIAFAPSLDAVLVEPMGRNTAAAVALAALHAAEQGDPHVLVLPSDQQIGTVEQFGESVAIGIKAADAGDVVTFGITPDHPATGYGYVEAVSDDTACKVARFVEKPDLETAKSYLETGRYLWNAGIFLSRASVLLDALERHAGDILEQTKLAYVTAKRDGVALDFDAIAYGAIRSQSIDFAVMEQADNVSVVRAAFSWSDIGSFRALKENLAPEPADNAVQGDVIALNTSGSLIRSEGPLVTTLGVEKLAVIATPDATFVAPLERSEEVKSIVNVLQERKRRELVQTRWKAEGGATPGGMAEKFRSWLFDAALPFWLKHGLDSTHGGFHEVLDFSGSSTGADKRLRTMARQIYVFAKAKQMGWSGDAAAAVEHGLAFFNQAGEASWGGWFKTFDATSQPLDLNEDVYDHAFIRLAMSQAKLAGFRNLDAISDRNDEFLHSMIVRDGGGSQLGYQEDSAGTLPRRSNPHMHMLEAALASYEATGNEASLQTAAHIADLFEQKFFCKDRLILLEAFTADLGTDATTSADWEPGHHFEWAWLLWRYGECAGRDMTPAMLKLMASAKGFGVNPVSGLAHDVIQPDGSPRHQSARCWPQTEWLKAELALARSGQRHAVYAAERVAERLWSHYVEPAPEGLWNDVCDVAGQPISQSVPASTFYHIICAMDEYLTFHAGE
ncbi:MAG: AGE family epimerase/isomerase [Ahrensia sp.]|nr:AGE family epimerase/isomerase [Ahrensia sp.]